MTEIRSAETALIEAERLLASVNETDTSTSLWKSSAVYPLAAILLAVAHDSGGFPTLAAVHNVVARPDAGVKHPGVLDWLWAARACPNEMLAEALRQASAMGVRQRDSIKSVILEALLNEMGAKIIAVSPANTNATAHVIDEQRHAWIAAHSGIFLFQKRRAALLNRQLRDRQRGHIGLHLYQRQTPRARADGALYGHLGPHETQLAPPPLLLRGLEIVVVAVAALAVPIGWAAGRLLYRYITTFIPERLRAYPIPVLLWASVVAMTPLALTPLAHWPTPVQLWLLAQGPAIFLVAGIYGILEGWLAVEGSTAWWPPAFAAPKTESR